MQDPIDQFSRSRDRVCVITWSTVLISFHLSFWKRTRFAVVTSYGPLLLLCLVIYTTSKSYMHADVVTIVTGKTSTAQLQLQITAHIACHSSI